MAYVFLFRSTSVHQVLSRSKRRMEGPGGSGRVCVCARERARERERDCVCVCVCVRERESERGRERGDLEGRTQRGWGARERGVPPGGVSLLNLPTFTVRRRFCATRAAGGMVGMQG